MASLKLPHGPSGRRAFTLGGQRGQALSEYVTILGFMVGTVIACMALFVSPVAWTFVWLCRRLVLYMTSTP